MYFLLLGHMMQCPKIFHVIGAPARCPQGYKHDYSLQFLVLLMMSAVNTRNMQSEFAIK